MVTKEQDWRGKVIEELGGTGYSKDTAKRLLKAGDVTPPIDTGYLGRLKDRLAEIARALTHLLDSEGLAELEALVLKDWESIVEDRAFEEFSKRIGFGRRPEKAVFDWMRGRMGERLFDLLVKPNLGADISIERVGGDAAIDELEKRPDADYLLSATEESTIRIELQTGFASHHDVKLQKILEASRRSEDSEPSVVVFLDFFSNQVFVFRLDAWQQSGEGALTDGSRTRPLLQRQQMEGQWVVELGAMDVVSSLEEFASDPSALIDRLLEEL